jgi:hypothetical protein
MRTGTSDSGQSLRNLMGVIAVSFVAMCGAALVPVSTAAAANATSVDFAGFQATSRSTIGSASVEFRVPAIQCNQNLQGLALFGSFLDGLFGPGIAAVLVHCGYSFTPIYYALPNVTNSVFPRPGDLVRTMVTMSKTAIVKTFSDLTQGVSDSASFAPSPGRAVAYDGVSTYICIFACGYNDVVSFGKIRMFDARLNGVTPRTAGATAVDMQDPPFGVATSALNTTGNAWTEVWTGP